VIYRIFSIALLAINLKFNKSDPTLVQIFDVKQEKVIKQITLTNDLMKSIITSLDSTPKMYDGFSVNPNSGIVLHVEFMNSIKLSSAIYPDLIKEVYLFLEDHSQPKALIFFNSSSKYIVVVLDEKSDQFTIQDKLN